MSKLAMLCGGTSLAQKDHRPSSASLYRTDVQSMMAPMYAGANPEGGEVPLSLIDLHFSMSKLPNLDRMSLTDPMVVVYTKQGQGDWYEVGRTEIIKDDLDPQFLQSVQVNYYFEKSQPLKFVAYDIDDWNDTKDVKKQELIGECGTQLAAVITSRTQSMEFELQHPSVGKKRGFLKVSAEEVAGVNEILKIQFACKHLPRKDWYGINDPYLRISRSREDGTWIPVWRSETHKWTMNPKFKMHHLSVQQIANGDHQRPILVEVMDWRRMREDVLVGSFTTSINQLLEGGQHGREYEVIKQKHVGTKNYKNSGTCEVLHVEVLKQHSFLDFVFGGCEISLMVAVDFTASNGDPNKPTSLHFRGSGRPNEYQQAILDVGGILEYYDTDKLYPVFGFGAKDPLTQRVSHCFALNGMGDKPEVDGVSGMMAAYLQALNHVTLFGPTCFAPVINVAASYASKSVTQDNQGYYVLLILTDGVIMDMEQTVYEIVKASSLPLSIIIVGVGQEDFSAMEVLDADETPLRSGGVVMARDIVQFVPFRDFVGKPAEMLARAVLEEIPTQMLSYFSSRRIVPNKRLSPAELTRKASSRKNSASGSTPGSSTNPPAVNPSFLATAPPMNSNQK